MYGLWVNHCVPKPKCAVSVVNHFCSPIFCSVFRVMRYLSWPAWKRGHFAPIFSQIGLYGLELRAETLIGNWARAPQSLTTDSNRSKSRKISPVDLPKLYCQSAEPNDGFQSVQDSINESNQNRVLRQTRRTQPWFPNAVKRQLRDKKLGARNRTETKKARNRILTFRDIIWKFCNLFWISVILFCRPPVGKERQRNTVWTPQAINWIPLLRRLLKTRNWPVRPKLEWESVGITDLLSESVWCLWLWSLDSQPQNGKQCVYRCILMCGFNVLHSSSMPSDSVIIPLCDHWWTQLRGRAY